MSSSKNLKENQPATGVIEKSDRNKWKYTVLACIGIISTCILLTVGVTIFHDYRNTLMQNQQEQLLLMARSLSRNMSSDIENYINEINFFSHTVDDAYDRLIKEYVDRHLDFAINIFVEDGDGNVIKSARPMTLSGLQCVTDAGNGITIWQGYSGTKDVLIFKKELGYSTARSVTNKASDSFTNTVSDSSLNSTLNTSINAPDIIAPNEKTDVSSNDESDTTLNNKRYIALVIDEDEYYDNVIADIHIGTNGYIVVKNSSNLMLMHPSKDQWGINVIPGRMEMYPDLDYTSLQALLDEQSRGIENVSVYYSYWWLDDTLPRVRKISGYSPAPVGRDFWIVSAVVDYDDFYRPIMEGFQGIILVGLGILLVFIIAFVSILKLIKANDRASTEINYLKNLNQVLEEMHRSENAIAHQQRLQIMGTMTGGIAHEFNNFLTPIMGHAELLMMSLPEDSDEYDSAREILRASEKAKDVVHQMSSMSRKNVETIYRNLEASKLVNRFFRMSQSICPESVEVIKENTVGDEYILGNSTQINQVLLNIAVNGVQAIGDKTDGILKLKAYVKNQSDIKLKELPKESVFKKYLVFEISDNGIGMSPKVKKQIFEPFYTTKKPGEGTGLGLSLAEQIVEEHKGFIHIETEINKGTTFYVYFPVVEMQSGSDDTGISEDVNGDGAALPDKISLKTADIYDKAVDNSTGKAQNQTDNKASAKGKLSRHINVIVVDDNHKILSILNDSLNAREMINAVMCDSTESLHSALSDMTPDIVLIDESVGNYSGIEIFMSELTDYKDTLKLIMADTIDREIVEARKRGLINGYMEKPVSDVEIIRLTEQIADNINNLNKL